MKNDYKLFSFTSSILPTISFSFLFPSPGYRNLQGSVWGIKVTTGRKRAWILSTFQFSTTFWLSAHFQPFTSHCTGHHPKLTCPQFLIFPFFFTPSLPLPLLQTPSTCLTRKRREKNCISSGDTTVNRFSCLHTPGARLQIWQNHMARQTCGHCTHCYSVSEESQCYTPIIFLSLVSPLFQPFSTLLKLPSQPWCLLLS